MSQAIFSCIFKLKKGKDRQEFLEVAKTLNNEYISKQKGYISWEQCVDNETWADFIRFETMEDAQNFVANSESPNEFAEKFYGFINMPSCKVNLFAVAKVHGGDSK